MKYPIKVGVVCLARHTFDSQAAADLYRAVRDRLAKLEATRFEFVLELVVEVDQARAAAERLAASDLDGLICISGTFHLGHLVLELAKGVDKPLLLWAWNELPYDGGKIRLNSVCGLNLDASNLYKAGIRNYHTLIADELDTDWLDALRVLRCFREARVGIAGHHAHGFFNLSCYEPTTYRALGVLVDHYELDEIWGLTVSAEDLARHREKLGQTFELSGVSGQQIEKVAALAARLRAFIAREKLHALAIRCWPEFAARYGVSTCAAMSLLQSEGLILGCEGDLEGALSMLAHTAVGGETPFLFDFSQVNFAENFALLWHCGVAPANLWDEVSVRSLEPYFGGGKGVTADFVLKPGPISILRLDSAGTEQRIYLQRASGVPMPKQLKGTYLKVQFEEPVHAVLQQILDHGVAHHASMVYGNFLGPFRMLSRIKGWSLIGPGDG